MSLTGLLTRACTITHRTWDTTLDAYGDQTATTTTASTVCELQQQQAQEHTDPGTIADSSWLLVLPAGTTVKTGDTVTVAGDEYEIAGEPWPARNPRTGAASHIECTAKRVTGAA